ncbi:MAG: glycosyltransferase [Fimbriiglobus sp.]
MPPFAPPAPVRVGFVVHVMQVAGAEVLVRETVRRLGNRIIPTVFCLDAVGPIGEELAADGVDVVCLGRRPGWDFAVSRKLAAESTRRRIDVLHAHQYGPFFYSALAKPLIRPMPRLLLTEHGRHFPDVVGPWRRAANRLVLDRLADRVTACCHFSGRALCQIDGFAGARIEVIENGIDPDKYGPPADAAEQKRKLGLDPARRYVANVARHHPVKDQPTLIRGFARIVGDVPDAVLLMVGDGPKRPDLEALAAELGIGSRVRFLGVRADVPEVLRAASVFGLTSVSEAASLTLLEAMATGIPVAVTAVGGNPEIVRHEREGLLFPRSDVVGCGNALRRLLTDDDLAERLGEAGRDRVRERYRLDATIGAYHRLYRELAGR